MNPYEPPDVARGLAKSEFAINPTRVLLCIVGGLCAFRGLSLIYDAFFEITLLVFAGTAIWLARQHFDAQMRLATIGWSVAALLLGLARIAIDPPSTRNVAELVVVSLIILIVVIALASIAWIAFRTQPVDRGEQPTTSSEEPLNSLSDSSGIHNGPMEWSWRLFARWSLSLSLITILGALLAGLGFFFLIVVPVGYFFDVRLARLAFNLPLYVAPGIWAFGMFRCYRTYSSKRLIISLCITGVALCASLPMIMFFAVMAYSGGWNVR